MPSSSVQISVIIPSARPDKVFKTLESLKAQSTNTSFEIIVVTPKNENGLCGLPANCSVVYVDSLYPPGKMRNIGTKTALGDYFCFIDDDCVSDNDFIETLFQALLQDNSIGEVGCRVVSKGKNFWAKSADYSLFAAYQYNKVLIIELGSSAIMVRRIAFETVEGFDEHLLASEDWDFSLRLQAKGWKCLFTPGTEVLHDHGRDSFMAIVRCSFLSGERSKLTVQQRHREQLSWLAKLSLLFRSPFIYWILILPYAVLISSSQSAMFCKTDKKVIFHFPIMLLSRVSYHFGVWMGLIKQRSCC